MERAMKLWTLQNTLFIAFLCVSLTVVLRADQSSENERETYIVYMGGLPKNTMSLMDAHNSLLSETIGDAEIATTSMIHTYEKSFNGFAARLLPREAELLSQKEGVVSVFQNQVRRLVTTRSWDFIGMPLNITRNHQAESDTIVALFDSGIWPDSPSFDDTGFGPPPSKWKGKCDTGPNFTRCNNKVIGARYFKVVGNNVPAGIITPGDNHGHGTHTASTAAGNAVANAALYGISRGTARGGVPSSRVASYKVCWGEDGGCQDVDILAAFDAAISDGVDVISVSIAGGSQAYLDNSIAIGSFHAARRGIVTVCAAGNSGPRLWSVANIAPWVVTVAASTVDRRFVADVVLGNGQRISGSAINVFEPKKQLYPLTSGAKAQNVTADLSNEASSCYHGTLSKNKVQGRVVYCKSWTGEFVVGKLGGVGTIMAEDSFPDDAAFTTSGPGSYVTETNGAIIDKYINSTREPRAVIMKTRTTVQKDAPAVASFSSRGPQTISIHILKPDITAPGVNILAAHTKHATLTGQEGDNRIVTYNIQSGTSMACPHVAGAAAYVKTFHPNWSPAAIRSALMTTAKEVLIKPTEAELAYGSGVINPKDAINPGLVYDIDTTSYISFLCKEGYTDKQIATLTGDPKHSCSEVPEAKGYDGLNYPSVYLQLGRKVTDFWAEFHRTVTNVGDDNSGNNNNEVVYKAEVSSPKELSVTVDPSVLTFDNKGNKTMSFKVVLTGKFPENTTGLSGSITWTDSVHRVRSPVYVYRSNYI